ncbi:hypothetical protein ONZ45_g7277 [Pleurotus djamor]|nr:hypothetical protein ONZ45_g7277 [Pleurotus djamor]
MKFALSSQMRKTLFVATFSGVALASSRQDHYDIFNFQRPGSFGQVGKVYDPRPFDAPSFSPLKTLDALVETDFTVFGHPAFPRYSVRAKRTQFCDSTVNSYTGYIDIEARHLFFYFFESRNDPDKDDVVFWTNGGPGGSSAMGLFMELGPCRILDENGPTFHPESWNSNANIFFIDQPVGVGYSYADYGEFVSTTEEAAQDIAAFVAIFFENFSKFQGRGFHLSGESYGGRYLPSFAAAIYDQNAKLIEQEMTPINLTSVMIGDYMVPAWAEFQCTHASIAPFQSIRYDPVDPQTIDYSPIPVFISTCITMKQMMPRCQRWFKAACIDHFDAIDCNAATTLCQEAVSAPYILAGKNPYDISKDCEGKYEETYCYPLTIHIQNYLSRPDVRDLLGVDPSVRENFTIADPNVHNAFTLALDMFHPTVDHVAALLERGVRVLIYVGSYDWICNWLGNQKWTLDMEWSGKEEFGKKELVDWTVNGKFAGKTRSAKGLTFATVHGAGHMVPYDKATESLEMVKRWMSKEAL